MEAAWKQMTHGIRTASCTSTVRPSVRPCVRPCVHGYLELSDEPHDDLRDTAPRPARHHLSLRVRRQAEHIAAVLEHAPLLHATAQPLATGLCALPRASP